MHGLLRTLPLEQKPRWPVHLPELVQAYNNTPHASTRFSPYFQLFGQVDDLLGRPARTAAGTVDWVRQHRLRLQEANHKAVDHLKQAAANKRACYTDKGAADHALQVGDHVYISNHVLGRNKIQDFWRPELPRVTSRPFDYHVNRAVHLNDIVPATTPFVVGTEHQPNSLRFRGQPSVTVSQTVTTTSFAATSESSYCCCAASADTTARDTTCGLRRRDNRP